MIRKPYSYFILIYAICLASCVPNVITTPTNARTPSPVTASPTFTVTPTETKISTQPATLTLLEANEKIRAYLQEPVDCPAPCFWGITPGQTTFAEVTNIFASLGLQPEHTLSQNNQEFYDTNYHIEKGLEISILFSLQDSIIKTLTVGINDTSEVGTPRKWSTYSPETLINQYGIPSEVDFFIGRVAPRPIHSMVLYFEAVSLIVEYSGIDIINDMFTLQVCPITNQVDLVRIWMGKDPRYPPKSFGISLEEATSLTLEEFSNLMTGNPEIACFNLKSDMFP